MEQSITDIIVTTHNRLDYLKQTLQHIWERTRSPYKLHVIDDASKEGNVEWLLEQWRAGKIESLLLRGERHGLLPNLSVATWMTFSDPFVVTDDDILCPDVEPDWLARGVQAMRTRSHLGLLALNHPGAGRKALPELQHPKDKEVRYCQVVGGTLLFVRRELAEKGILSRRRYDLGVTPGMIRCRVARQLEYEIGYLIETYCQHIGVVSILTERNYSKITIEPVDLKTLEPPERWRY